MSDALQTLTEADVRRLAAADPYWRGRWEYLSVAAEFARSVPGARRVLEIGPYTQPLVIGADTMDCRVWPGGPKPTLLHDATETPWPIADGAYDLAVALQVWEHLTEFGREAFDELTRVARYAVLSLPWNWPGENTHSGIGWETIDRWTGGLLPYRWAIAGKTLKRVVILFDLEGS